MYSKIYSTAVMGLDGITICVEADVSNGLPMFTLVGYLSSSVKEAGERVRTALKNSGINLPPKRITINLSPADIRKNGSYFDLAIAIAVRLALSGVYKTEVNSLSDTVIIGELSLNGEVLRVNGVLPMVHHAKNSGFKRVIVPYTNRNEASLIKGISVIGVKSLNEAWGYLTNSLNIPVTENDVENLYNKEKLSAEYDFSDVKGQHALKRGLEIAAAGFHNILMTGAAGSGKTMMAKCLPGIMPGLTFEECIEITKIYSIAGLLTERNSLITKRPFRSPHHTISRASLIGGGAFPVPGEISLANKAVLFLDEFPEFNKLAIEALRQPMEEKKAVISRLNAVYTFPADFMLVAAMNMCPCGNFPDRTRCSCSEMQIIRYQNKISRPIMDRIDISMEVRPVTYENLFSDKKEESSEKVRERVEDAIEIQNKRYRYENIRYNSQLKSSRIKNYIFLGEREEELLKKYFTEKELSARGVHRILKLSRTIADLGKREKITCDDISEALFYRNAHDRNTWGEGL